MKNILILFIGILLITTGFLSGCTDNSNNQSINNELNFDPNYYDSLGSSLHTNSRVPIGCAVNVTLLRYSQKYRNVIAYHFNSLTPGNAMKMDALVPSQGVYRWTDADLILDFADKINADVHGHVLVWHNQQPDWLYTYSGPTEDWKNLLKNHIQTVVGRYKGDIKSWDVINEAFNDDGSGFRNTIWYENIGEEYFADAFRWANEADPDAILYYNDFSLSANTSKLNSVLDKIGTLIDEGVPIHGIGFQMHITDEWPTIEDMRGAIEKVEQLDINLRISELDVSMNQNNIYTFFSDDLSLKQKQRYQNVTSLFLQSSKLDGITLWGVADADSWIPDYFHRLDWPLLFDENYEPKPSAQGFLETLI